MTVPAAPQVTLSVSGAVATVVLNRPEKRNALSASMVAELKGALRAADLDPVVRVVALRGAGPDFCSGADLVALERMTTATVAENLADVDALAELFLLPRAMSRPVVAVVTGRALAGGCGLATACDLVVAAESASFGYTEIRLGFVPAMVSAILRRNVGEKRAFELIAGGEVVGAREAERLGLINRAFPDAELEAGAAEYLARLAERSPTALALCKRVLYRQDGLGFEAAVRAGADVNVIARASEELRAGVSEFLASRSDRPREG
jgi:methylglutaconyl-CoA hydratase